MSPRTRSTDPAALKTLVEGDPSLDRIRREAAERPLFLVGGSVRDALLGAPGFDLDLAYDGPVGELALRLDQGAILHERFDTAEIEVAGRHVDIARTRSERYAHPGALPEVEPARIEADLLRRDFTINAMAVPIARPGELIDPLDGMTDLRAGVLRVIHPGSFKDDPTRALRAARYSARLGFDLDPRTADLLSGISLSAISRERVESELELIADEESALKALRLIDAWGLLEISEGQIEMIASGFELLERPAWRAHCGRRELLLGVIDRRQPEDLEELIAFPGSASRAARMAARRSPVELLLARAVGAEWLDRWVSEWRDVEIEITGDDLLRAGIPRGEAIGAGLRAALDASLDRGLHDRESQFEVALSAARRADRGSGST